MSISMGCNCHGRCMTSKIGWSLVLIGGINWGLVGLGMLVNSDLNVLGMIFGVWPSLLAVIYLLVGASALVMLFGCKCKKCKVSESNCAGCKVEGAKLASNPSM